MRMLNFVSTFIIFVFTPGVAFAESFAGIIEGYCSQGAPAAPTNQLSKLLNQVQENFKDQETRVKNPEAFVAALDEV